MPGLSIKYKSEDGYAGQDSMRILLLFPDGSATEGQFLILAR
jgi:hypothetical protein